ncbi:hypothetical protein ACIQNU_02395 [Streptomyces sp. NPDC091292]
MRPSFTSPLARWGFTTLAALAIATAQPGPTLVCTVLALYSWKVRRP